MTFFNNLSIVDHNKLSYRMFCISATERTCPLETWHYVRSSNTATGCSGFTSDHCLSLNNESTSGNNIDEIKQYSLLIIFYKNYND